MSLIVPVTIKVPDSKPPERKHWEIAGLKSTPKRGYCSIPVLEFLNGRELDDVAFGFIHALRPSCVEIIHDWSYHCNSVTWRVRVFCENNIIKKITQEVHVGLYDTMNNGQDLLNKLKNNYVSNNF